jgi:hypothetical protein
MLYLADLRASIALLELLLESNSTYTVSYVAACPFGQRPLRLVYAHVAPSEGQPYARQRSCGR